MPVQATLSAHLHGQLNVLPLMPRDMALAHALVDSLDDDGYLRSPLEELALTADLQPRASAEELQIALRRVQSLDPAGVGARSVAECLRLQLPAIACPELRGLAAPHHRRTPVRARGPRRGRAVPAAGRAARARRGRLRGDPPPRPAPGLAP